ncbi:MAG TPA: hypothetical protein VMX94_12035 [Armatimonadota bacterium]|nr:hypothetical protein [Armatimonadota bacterium]
MQALIERLKAQGIRLELQGGSLRVHAAVGALTPEIRELLRTHSAQLARELNDSDGAEGEGLTVEGLVDLIRGQLEGRPLPIAIRPGESIVGVEVYVRSEARTFLRGCPLAVGAVRGRLQCLGIAGRALEG